MGSHDATSPRRRGAGELESEVLAMLWAADGTLTPREIRDALGGELAYNTVHTILTRLHDKGLVVRNADGRRGAWRTVPEAAARTADLMHDLMKRGPNHLAVLQQFVTALDPADERALRDLLGEERRRTR